MIIQQLKHCFRNKKFILFIMIGILVNVFSIINEIAPYISFKGMMMNITNSMKVVDKMDDPFNQYSLWCDSLKSYMLAIPILCAIPFSSSYVEDIKSGMIKYINLRISHKKYSLSKLLANSIIGGLITIIPTVFCTIIIFGVFNGDYNTCYISKIFGGKYNYLFLNKFPIYVLFQLMVEFLIGATYSSIALCVSTRTKNNIAILLSPYVFYMISSVVLSLLNLSNISPETINQFYYDPSVSLVDILVNLTIIYLISSFTFLHFSKKEFIYENLHKKIKHN